MSQTGRLLLSILAGLRRLAWLSWAAGLAGGLAAIFGLSAWAARLGWLGQPAWVLGTWALGTALAAGLSGLMWRRLGELSPPWLAGAIGARGFRGGTLRGLLGPAAAGTSLELLAVADLQQAEALARSESELLAPIRAGFHRRALRSGSWLIGAVLLLISARPLGGPPARLWRPGEAWAATVAPVTIRLSATTIDRGGSVEATVTAAGHRHAILWVRGPGEPWRGQGLGLDSLGRATTVLGPLENDLFLRLTSGGRSSDTLQVRVRMPVFLGSLTVTARYPRYLALEDEPLPTDGDTIVVPEGTRLETVGEATTELLDAAWVAGSARIELPVSGGRFHGGLTPAATALWSLALSARSGEVLAGDPVRLPVVLVPDSVPTVEVPVPGSDAIIPLTLRVPLVIDAADDHGLTRVVVESRRISRLGFADPPVQEAVPLPDDSRSRVLLPYDLDLNLRNLLPGDTVRFTVLAADNAPRAHQSRSTEYVLRLPSLAEVRQAARATSAEVGQRLDSITEASRRLERQTEDLSRERVRAGQKPGGPDQSLSFENAKRAESVAEAQAELLRQAEQVRQTLEQLQQSADAAGLHDPAWQQRLQEIQQELARALTPELRQRLQELQQALQELDPERSREALERLAEAQARLREALERSRELFKRAAVEGDLANLTAEARDLAADQKRWLEQLAREDSLRAAAEEAALGERADSLGASLDRLSAELESPPDQRPRKLQQSAERARSAARRMQRASQAARQGKQSEAAREGQQAEEQLEPLGDELKSEREELQQSWRQEVMRGLDQAMGDVSRLAERQLRLAETLRRGDTSPGARSEEGAVEEGVERLLETMKQLAGKHALVSQQTSVALAAARDAMRQAREALATAAPNTREAGKQAGEAIDALNAAAFGLLRSKGAVEGAGSGSGLQEAMEQMAQLAQQQGQLGQQSGGLLPQMGQGGPSQDQLRALGARQRALAEQLERLRAGGQIPGAADMADEAADLARRMEAAQLDRQTVERQERLFRRMLDAGRTLQGQEQDEQQERQSTTAAADSIRLPPVLRARRDAEAGFQLPRWDELQALTPEERRRVLEYFRRLGEGAGERNSAP